MHVAHGSINGSLYVSLCLTLSLYSSMSLSLSLYLSVYPCVCLCVSVFPFLSISLYLSPKFVALLISPRLSFSSQLARSPNFMFSPHLSSLILSQVVDQLFRGVLCCFYVLLIPLFSIFLILSSFPVLPVP